MSDLEALFADGDLLGQLRAMRRELSPVKGVAGGLRRMTLAQAENEIASLRSRVAALESRARAFTPTEKLSLGVAVGVMSQHGSDWKDEIEAIIAMVKEG